MKCYTKAVEKSPQVKSLYNLALVQMQVRFPYFDSYWQLNKLEDAVKSLNKLLAIQPK